LRLIKYAMDAIFSFSYKPLRLGLALGSGAVAVSLMLAFLLLVSSIFGLRGLAAAGFAGTFLSVLLLAGVQLVCTGLLGEYIGRIYEEVRHRPLFLIQTLHQNPALPELTAGADTRVRLQVANPPGLDGVDERVVLDRKAA